MDREVARAETLARWLDDRYLDPVIGFLLPGVGDLATSGVGLYGIAAGSTLFILVVLWLLESLQPEAQKHFALKIKGKHVDDLSPRIEPLLRGRARRFEVRTTGPGELAYEVYLPADVRTDRLSNAIIALDPEGKIEVEWDEKKK